MNRELPTSATPGRRSPPTWAAYPHGWRAPESPADRGSEFVQPSVYRAGTGGDGGRAIFLLDPPYATSGDLYAATTDRSSKQARQWCISAPSTLRIVIAGYDTEHAELERVGWAVVQGEAGGGAGMSTDPKRNGRRERLWMSPACLHTQETLWGGAP